MGALPPKGEREMEARFSFSYYDLPSVERKTVQDNFCNYHSSDNLEWLRSKAKEIVKETGRPVVIIEDHDEVEDIEVPWEQPFSLTLNMPNQTDSELGSMSGLNAKQMEDLTEFWDFSVDAVYRDGIAFVYQPIGDDIQQIGVIVRHRTNVRDM